MNPEHEAWLNRLEQVFQHKVSPLLDKAAAEMEILPPPPDPLRPTPSAEQMRAEVRSEMGTIAFPRKEHERLLRGADLVFARLDDTPHPDQCRLELSQAMEKLGDINAATEEMIDVVVEAATNTDPNADADEADVAEFWEEAASMRENLGISLGTFQELYGIGLKYFEDREIENAASVFRFLTMFDVTCYEAWYSYGLCQQELQELDGAISSFVTAITVDGLEPNGYYQLARTYFLQGDSSTKDAIIDLANANLADLGADEQTIATWKSLAENVQ